MTQAIGIDLGTTNSVGCVVQNDQPRVILNTFHEELTPSVVQYEQFDEEDEGIIQVGRPAFNQAKLFPEDTIFSIKRIIGRKFGAENVEKLRELANYEIMESEEPVKGLAAVRMGGKTYLPEDISGMILSNVAKYCGDHLRSDVTHAVITVPAYFGEPEKAATREAGCKAGLVVKTLLPEPTAAALAYGVEAKTEGSFLLVYDLGGGTFDISIISIVEQNYNVMAVHGDHFLGGDDFDEKIVEKILAHVEDKHGEDLSDNTPFRIVAKREAENAKKILSNAETASILIPEAAEVGDKKINIRMRITREEFEDSIRDLVSRSIDLTREALNSQSLSAEDIDTVLLVGGSTAVPLVRQEIENLFGPDKVRHDVNPMHCVAMGAAIMADRMKGIECPECKEVCDESASQCSNCGASLSAARAALENMEVTEITTNHFGIQAVSGDDPHAFTVLVEKGTEIPMAESRSATLYTTEEDQDRIRLPVYEGLGSSVLQNSRIGVMECDLPVGLPKNHPVDISLKVDRQSIVSVNVAVDEYAFYEEDQLKRELQEEALPPEEEEEESLLPDDDEEVDEAEKMLAILDNFVQRTQHFRDEYREILTDAQDQRLEKAIGEAQDCLDTYDGEHAQRHIITLQQLTMRCGTASVLDQAQIAAGATDEDTADQIQTAARQLRSAAESGDQGRAREITRQLTPVLRSVFARERNVDEIDTAGKFDHLLRDGMEK